VVVVPLVVVAFVVSRRQTRAGETIASATEDSRGQTEHEFAEAEAFEAKWHEEDKERFHRERLP
jgi:hypothetical protein